MAVTIFCAGLMAITYQMPRAAASDVGGGGSSSTWANNTSGTLVYPYAVPASLFPTPANVTSANGVVAVSAVPLPNSPSAYAVVNASSLSNGSDPNASVWFSVASYSSTDAVLVARNGSCGQNCGDLPLEWTNPTKVATFSAPITALQVGVLGSVLVVGATSSNSTYLYSQSSQTGEWTGLYSALPGQLESLATDPIQVAVATVSGGSVIVSSISAGGSLVGRASISPTGPTSAEVVSAALTLVPEGSTYEDYLAFSVNGSDQIEASSSSDGIHFSRPTPFANFTALPSNVTTADGDVAPAEVGLPGQLALAATGAELTLLYTTYLYGAVTEATVSSGDLGAQWDGPYLAGAANGTVENPILTVGPAGLVYGAWAAPNAGAGTLEEATFEADGMPLTQPEAIFAPNTTVPNPAPSPALAVDGFERPLVLWPANSPNGTGAFDYTGAYLAPNTSLNLTENLLNATLGAWDFQSPGTSQTGIEQYLGNVSEEVEAVDAAYGSESLCQAQNLTGISLYQELARVPLAVSGTNGAACGDPIDPNPQASPLLAASGVDDPTTFSAVYLDWALQAEGVPVSSSPLAALTEVAPYSQMALPTSVPNATSGQSAVDSATETISVTPTPYSPTSYDLSTSATLPVWTKSLSSFKCSIQGGGSGIVTSELITSVNATWTNVTLNGGALPAVAGSGSYPSVWLDNLSAEQSYAWSATYRALTSEAEKTYDSCSGQTSYLSITPVSLGPSSIPTVTLNGSFATTLYIVAGKPLVLATYNSNHSSANLTVEFNSSLPSTFNGSLSNGSGSQTWSTSAPAINGTYTLERASPVGQTYSVTVVATSRPGGAPATSPSRSYGAAETFPPEKAAASCGFTLTSAVPTVTISNQSGAPFVNVSSSTANVTWTSTADALGFFTYYEVGTAINQTVSGIQPVQQGPSQWVYSLEVHGLEPMVVYNATVGVSWSQGCLVDQEQIVGRELKTGSHSSDVPTHGKLAHVWGISAPYDPFNDTGGGVEVGWDSPSRPRDSSGAIQLENGTVVFKNRAGQSFTIPFSLEEVAAVPTPNNTTHGAYTLDIADPPSLAQNTHYGLTVNANYSYTVSNNGTEVTKSELAKGTDIGFVYERDQTDGGLSDATKDAGWWAIENGTSTHVYPTEDRDSTNGLVGDYVEMEYSLNPGVLDTSGSHMLDTYNLTFLIGPEWSTETTDLVHYLSNSTYFQFYNDSGSYNYTANSRYLNLTNLTCELKEAKCHAQGWSGDSSPWASEVLWSSSLLQVVTKKTTEPGAFVRLLQSASSQGWLRASLGTYRGSGKYEGDLIMTVWGKLSWGADPWEWSTSNDSLADGNQTDPLGPVVLRIVENYWQLNGTNLTADNSPESLINLTVVQNGTPTTVYSNYSEPAVFYSAGTGQTFNANWSPADVAYAYVASVPLAFASGTVNLSMTIQANYSSNGSPADVAYAKFGSYSNPTLTYSIDLTDFNTTTPTTVTAWLSPSQDSKSDIGEASLNYTVLPPVSKATTFLITPKNETTLAWDAPGYARYVGEPDFDLIVLNLSENLSSRLELPNASGGPSYSVTLKAGMNNILVPRGIFLTSPLEQAILNNSTGWVNNGTWGLNFSLTNWSSRMILNQSTPSDDPWYIRVFNATNYSEVDSSYYDNTSTRGSFGGDSGLKSEEQSNATTALSTVEGLNLTSSSWDSDESNWIRNLAGEQGDESRQIQSVIWINITGVNAGWLSLPEPVQEYLQVQSLLSGLVLNASGALTSVVCDTSGYLSWLNLPSTVVAAISAPQLINYGSFSAPQYQGTSGDLRTEGFGIGTIKEYLRDGYNDVVGWAKGAACWWTNWTESIDTAFYNLTVSAGLYLAGAIAGALTTLTEGLSTFVQVAGETLVAIGHAMLWGLKELLRHIVEPLIQPAVNAAESFDASLSAATNTTLNDTLTQGNVTQPDALAWGQVFNSVGYLGLALGIGLTAALAILSSVCLEADFLVDLVLSLVPALTLEAISGLTQMSSLTYQAVMSLASSFSNPFPKATWETIAADFAICAAGGSFIIAVVAAAMKAPSDAFALTLAASIIMDLVVFSISWITWANHSADLAIIALVVSGLATYVAASAASISEDLDEAQSSTTVALILAVCGAGAAGADVYLAGT